jgi:cytochrome c
VARGRPCTPRSPTIVLVSLVLGAATAQPTLADAAKGSQLAQQWCASCHVISSNRAGNVQEGPPSFRTIAGSRTADQLRVFLSHPHGAMPDLSLTRAEIDDLIGYIETLR